MNVKQHIEAGHYPKDDKGRALVPMRDGRIATIAAIDFPNDVFPILGWPESSGERCWQAGGRSSLCGEGIYDLLPPAPRKVTMKRWLVVAPKGEYGPFRDRFQARCVASSNNALVVELTGEYEEPWS